jgi:hypothetical protein
MQFSLAGIRLFQQSALLCWNTSVSAMENRVY